MQHTYVCHALDINFFLSTDNAIQVTLRLKCQLFPHWLHGFIRWHHAFQMFEVWLINPICILNFGESSCILQPLFSNFCPNMSSVHNWLDYFSFKKWIDQYLANQGFNAIYAIAKSSWRNHLKYPAVLHLECFSNNNNNCQFNGQQNTAALLQFIRLWAGMSTKFIKQLQRNW